MERAAQGDDFAKAAAAQHEVSAGFGAFRDQTQRLVVELKSSARLTRDSGGDFAIEARKTHRSSLRVILFSFGAAAVLLLAGGFFLARGARRTVQNLKGEAQRLRDAVVAGRIEVRAESARVGKEFAPIVLGLNEIMDAFERPIRVTALYVTRIGKGDLPEPITDEYQGDFNLIKSPQRLHRRGARPRGRCRHAGEAGVEGRLATRAEATRHEGDFRKVIQGVNETLDAVVGPLEAAAETVGRPLARERPAAITATTSGDFALIQDNLNRCLTAVKQLVSDADALAQAGAAGRLETRADASRHQGDFRSIVEGVNRTLDAVTRPPRRGRPHRGRPGRGERPSSHRRGASRATSRACATTSTAASRR